MSEGIEPPRRGPRRDGALGLRRIRHVGDSASPPRERERSFDTPRAFGTLRHAILDDLEQQHGRGPCLPAAPRAPAAGEVEQRLKGYAVSWRSGRKRRGGTRRAPRGFPEIGCGHVGSLARIGEAPPRPTRAESMRPSTMASASRRGPRGPPRTAGCERLVDARRTPPGREPRRDAEPRAPRAAPPRRAEPACLVAVVMPRPRQRESPSDRAVLHVALAVRADVRDEKRSRAPASGHAHHHSHRGRCLGGGPGDTPALLQTTRCAERATLNHAAAAGVRVGDVGPRWRGAAPGPKASPEPGRRRLFDVQRASFSPDCTGAAMPSPCRSRARTRDAPSSSPRHTSKPNGGYRLPADRTILAVIALGLR